MKDMLEREEEQQETDGSAPAIQIICLVCSTYLGAFSRTKIYS